MSSSKTLGAPIQLIKGHPDLGVQQEGLDGGHRRDLVGRLRLDHRRPELSPHRDPEVLRGQAHRVPVPLRRCLGRHLRLGSVRGYVVAINSSIGAWFPLSIVLQDPMVLRPGK